VNTGARASVSVESVRAFGKASDTIEALASKVGDEDVSLGFILSALEDRGFGVLIMLFALPNAIIPGISFILWAPVVLLALQLALGRQQVWLPEFMGRRRLSAQLFRRIAQQAQKFLAWIEKRSHARWRWLVSGMAARLLALYIAVVAVFLMAPVPFGNALPALGISFISVGLIEKDGKAAAIGLIFGLFGAIYITAAIAFGIEALKAAVRLL
jgi:hypothetical protein